MAKKTTIPEGDAGYDIRATRVTVAKTGAPIFSQSAISVEIIDEAAGEFVRVVSESKDTRDGVSIDVIEWPTVRRAIDFMVSQCRNH